MGAADPPPEDREVTVMANPFDDDQGTFHVLRNGRGQYSLWPVFAEVPEGWDVVLQDASRAEADAHVQEHWNTLHPRHFVSTGGGEA